MEISREMEHTRMKPEGRRGSLEKGAEEEDEWAGDSW